MNEYSPSLHQSGDLALHYKQTIPRSLIEARRWLVWKYVKKEGEPKSRKIPLYVDGSLRGAGLALDTPEDVCRLSTFEEASAKFDIAHGGLAGVGFALIGGHGVGGIDLDNCLDENGVFTSGTAKQVYERAVADGAYAEVSPSGKGLRIIGSSRGFENFTRRGLEAYCKKRYLTVTGNCVANPKGFGAIDAPWS